MATVNGQPVWTVTIKGRQYVDCAERVRLAHAAGGGFSVLGSQLFQMGDTGRWFVQVTIAIGDLRYVGTSEVKLTAKPGSADGDSPVECAETSAVARALGFAGVGLIDSIASANEIARNQTAR